MQDLSYALQCPPRSLQDLQSLILAGKYGNQPGQLKPLDQLLVANLREELTARGYETHQMNYKGHAYNLLQELPLLLPSSLKNTVTEIISTTLKDNVSGVLLRVASIKVYLKLLKQKDIDSKVKQLLYTLVKISELLYASECHHTPKSVLQLYVTWLHHELCCDLPNPKVLTREKLYGVYFHDLVVHAPPQYQLVCLRSTNAESTERLFSQIKHISQQATNRKPDNVLTTILLSMQAKRQV